MQGRVEEAEAERAQESQRAEEADEEKTRLEAQLDAERASRADVAMQLSNAVANENSLQRQLEHAKAAAAAAGLEAEAAHRKAAEDKAAHEQELQHQTEQLAADLSDAKRKLAQLRREHDDNEAMRDAAMEQLVDLRDGSAKQQGALERKLAKTAAQLEEAQQAEAALQQAADDATARAEAAEQALDAFRKQQDEQAPAAANTGAGGGAGAGAAAAVVQVVADEGGDSDSFASGEGAGAEYSDDDYEDDDDDDAGDDEEEAGARHRLPPKLAMSPVVVPAFGSRSGSAMKPSPAHAASSWVPTSAEQRDDYTSQLAQRLPDERRHWLNTLASVSKRLEGTLPPGETLERDPKAEASPRPVHGGNWAQEHEGLMSGVRRVRRDLAAAESEADAGLQETALSSSTQQPASGGAAAAGARSDSRNRMGSAATAESEDGDLAPLDFVSLNNSIRSYVGEEQEL